MSGGGSERRMVDLLQRLDRAQFAPELYLAYQSGELLAEIPADVPIHAFADESKPPRFWHRMAQKTKLLSEARMHHLRGVLRNRHYDLIFAWGLRRAYETALPAWSTGTPRVVYCVQDPRQEVRLDFPFRSPWRWAVAGWSYRTADRIFANSLDLCRRVEACYRLPASSVELLVNLRDFAKLDELAAAPAPAWPATGFRLLTVGRLHEQKGHDLLLEAMSQLVHQQHRDIQLVICGQGPLESALRDQARRLQLENRVLFAGYVANPSPYYRSADVFVLPSRWEGSPNTLIEALALGTPAVAVDCPTGPREILDDGRHGTLVAPNDAGALVHAIAAMLDDLPAAQNRAAAAQAVIRAKYDLETGLRQFEARLLAVIHDSHRSSP